ncbi:transcriptional regulator [Embleya hyalina]|uniref:Transcriptional regulator n=2 Tax=Embleya hyalina TaxID=516124 RepID=A0A401YDE0_9ACTN|nr:transcriptional regulator [Embleya hyalina]
MGPTGTYHRRPILPPAGGRDAARGPVAGSPIRDPSVASVRPPRRDDGRTVSPVNRPRDVKSQEIMSASTDFRPVLVERKQGGPGSAPAIPRPRPTDAGPHRRALYRGTDPAAVHAAVASRLGPHRLRVPGGRINATFRALHEGIVTIHELAYGARADVYLDGSSPDYLIPIRHRGWGRVLIDGTENTLSPCVLGPDRPSRLSWEPDTSVVLLRIPGEVMRRAMGNGVVRSPWSPRELGPYLDAGDLGVRQWLSLARDFATMVDSGGGHLVGSRTATRHFEQVLVHGLLSCAPAHGAGPLRTGAGADEPNGLRRALAYCAEHAGEPISVGAVAAAAGMSVRTLQEKFRVHLGVTPVGHLRRVRLAGAHADLVNVAEGRSRDTVTDIALRWGFGHLGRFGSMYRETYGQLPSYTLRHGAAEDKVSRAAG